MTKEKALLIIEGSYLSSIVSAHTSDKVSTSAPYNFKLATELFAKKCGVEEFIVTTFCDALPYNDISSEISQNRIYKVKKYHNYLRNCGVFVKLGRTEKINNTQYRQEGVNTEIVSTMCLYHSKYDKSFPIVIVSADRSLYTTTKQLIEEGRKIIFIGSDHKEKNLYFKTSLRKLATDFINLSEEDVLKFKDRPDFRKDA